MGAPGLPKPDQGPANRIHPNVTPRLTLPIGTINPKTTPVCPRRARVQASRSWEEAK
jgi:hypothetical protein